MRSEWKQWARPEAWADQVADVEEALGVETLVLDDIITGAMEFAETFVEGTSGPLRSALSDMMDALRQTAASYGAKKWSPVSYD